MLTRRTFMKLMGGATAVAATGTDLLDRAAAAAAATVTPHGRHGVEHVVILMMENRSFDHFLGWLPGADGRHDLEYVSADGNVYPNYPLAPDFQGCGYSDPDHSWEGWLVQHNFGKMDGFLQRPTAPADNPGVTLAAANTFPVGYYTNRHPDGTPQAVPDLPVIGALAEHYTVLDRYFCSFAGETFPNRFYQHAAQTDRDHNSDDRLDAADHLGPALADPEHQGHPDRRLLLPGPAVPGAVGQPRVLPVLAPVRRTATAPTARRPDHARRRSSTAGRAAARCRTSASSTRPSTPRATARRPTTTRWPTSGSASGSSPTPTTRWPTTATWTTRCSS